MYVNVTGEQKLAAPGHPRSEGFAPGTIREVVAALDEAERKIRAGQVARSAYG